MRKTMVILVVLVFFIIAGIATRDFNLKSCCFPQKGSYEIEALPALAGSVRESESNPAVSVLSSLPSNSSNPFFEHFEFPAEKLTKDVKISISVFLPINHIYTEGQKLKYEVRLKRAEKPVMLVKGKLVNPLAEFPIVFNLTKISDLAGTIEIDLHIAYCSTTKPKVCKFKFFQIVQPFTVDTDGKANLELTAEVR